jgi:hypothetical protein
MPPLTIRRPHAARAVAALFAGAFIVLPLSADVAPSDPFEVLLRPAVLLDAADRRALDRSTAVIVLPPARGRDLVVFSAIRLAADGDRDRALGWLRHVDRLRPVAGQARDRDGAEGSDRRTEDERKGRGMMNVEARPTVADPVSRIGDPFM